jgi:transposase
VTENEAGPHRRDHQEIKMDTVYRGLAGIDVHKRMLAVVIRQQRDGAVNYEQRKFGTTRSEIEHLAAYLGQHGVSEVVLESTAQYWRPVWYRLEVCGVRAGEGAAGASQRMRLHLCHPLKTRGRRGRKSDFRDARRLVDRLDSGDLEDSNVPEAEQREWRWLTRTRVDLKDKVAMIRNQVEGLLEQGGIKLAAVVSDPFGVSGWAILQHIAKGEKDIEVMLQETRGTLRKKRGELREALAGRLSPVCQKLLQLYLEQVKLLWEQIGEIGQALERALKEYAPILHRLCRIPGVDLAAAQELIAELGL